MWYNIYVCIFASFVIKLALPTELTDNSKKNCLLTNSDDGDKDAFSVSVSGKVVKCAV